MFDKVLDTCAVPDFCSNITQQFRSSKFEVESWNTRIMELKNKRDLFKINFERNWEKTSLFVSYLRT